MAFGTLSLVGNERQRRAINTLHQAYKHWAIQDLLIIGEHLVSDIHIADPLAWFNKIESKTCGRDLNLQLVETFENPPASICANPHRSNKVLFTLLSPEEIDEMKRSTYSQLSRYSVRNSLLSLPSDVRAIECSILNYGILFDLELPLAWKGLSGYRITEIGLRWM